MYAEKLLESKQKSPNSALKAPEVKGTPRRGNTPATSSVVLETTTIATVPTRKPTSKNSKPKAKSTLLQKNLQRTIQANEKLQKKEEEKTKKLNTISMELKQKTTENAALQRENDKIKRKEADLAAQVARLMEAEKSLQDKLAAANAAKKELSTQTTNKRNSVVRNSGKSSKNTSISFLI